MICESCQGSGYIRHFIGRGTAEIRNEKIDGILSAQRECPICGGTGKVPEGTVSGKFRADFPAPENNTPLEYAQERIAQLEHEARSHEQTVNSKSREITKWKAELAKAEQRVRDLQRVINMRDREIAKLKSAP